MDEERFEAVWSEHGPAVLRYCTYSTGSLQEGEDVAAETFVRFLTRGGAVPPESVEAWLIRVARNLCATHHRTATRRRRLELDLAEDLASEAEPWTRPDSWEYVRRLKETERLVIYLRLAEDRSFADIACLLHKSEGAVKMTFYRAIERLRNLMIRDGASPDPAFVGGADCV